MARPDVTVIIDKVKSTSARHVTSSYTWRACQVAGERPVIDGILSHPDPHNNTLTSLTCPDGSSVDVN